MSERASEQTQAEMLTIWCRGGTGANWAPGAAAMLLRAFSTEVLISSSFLRELPFFILDTVMRRRCVSSYKSNSFNACGQATHVVHAVHNTSQYLSMPMDRQPMLCALMAE